MSSIGSLLSIARDAMTAASLSVEVTGQNIANASTPGYARRVPVLESNALVAGRGGGVLFRGADRATDRFADARLTTESGLHGAATAREAGLAGLEGVVAPPTGGVSDAMADLFAAATALASGPEDPTARAALLGAAEQTAAAFRAASSGLAARRADLFGGAQGICAEVNERTAQIAKLNDSIATSEASGVPAPELRDRRDVLIREVGERVGAEVVEEPNGSITLLSAGTALVQGGAARALSASLSTTGSVRIAVSKAGGAQTDVTAGVTSGTLGGTLAARDADIPKLTAALDALATDVAGAVNAVHQAGVGLDGVGGRPLFALTPGPGGAATLAVDASVAGRPDRLAAASSLASLPGGNDAAVALSALAHTMLGGGGLPAERAGALGASLGAMQGRASDSVALRSETMALAKTQHEQASGVSVEEEMVNLTRYQRAFEASMRVLKVADELLEGLIRG
ncbi:MAG: flagellar hook-associated protein FlgK [Polyangiaceae bacterium]